ncbi:hypothetical protein BDZ89DRAFT_1051686 [Hymenopellis radicata]|nr:hypothetical protein BDZ89DRAFT_1051686 [Hymenopellis radicata]
MPLLQALSSASRMRRAALKNVATRAFGPSADAQDDGQYALSITIEDLALARHEDRDDVNRNEDPAINILMDALHFHQILTTDNPSRPTPHAAPSTKQPSDFRKARSLRNHLHQQRGKAKRAARAETLRAQTGLLAEDLPATSTWWMGRQFAKASAAAIHAAHTCLEKRSAVSQNVLDLLPKFMEEAQEFVEACTSMGEDKIQGNRRGNHWFCIAGADRNNKTIPSLSEWHRENMEVIKHFFRQGTAMSAFKETVTRSVHQGKALPRTFSVLRTISIIQYQAHTCTHSLLGHSSLPFIDVECWTIEDSKQIVWLLFGSCRPRHVGRVPDYDAFPDPPRPSTVLGRIAFTEKDAFR